MIETMIEEDYETYKHYFFEIFPASNLEGMAQELHAALIAYQNRILELEAAQQGVQADERDALAESELSNDELDTDHERSKHGSSRISKVFGKMLRNGFDTNS